MAITIGYTRALARFASLCNLVVSTREPVVIRRSGSEDVAPVSAAELRSLMETAHLVRSPTNARRLLSALIRAQSQGLPTESIDKLRRESGLE